jgi:signal transduction histidine kinase
VASNDDSVILAAPEPTAAAMAHFRVLLQVSAAIGSIFDLDQLLNKVMDLVFEQLHAYRGFIGLIQEGSDRVVPVVVRYRDVDPSDKIAVSQTIIQHVMSKNEGVLSSNAMADKRFSKGKSVHNFSIRSAICVPIKGREGSLGVIHVDTMVANYTYTAEQLRLLTAIGLQTGMAIENLRLYREAVQKERLAAAGETVASMSHSIKNILQGIRGGADVVEMALKKGNLEDVRVGWKMLNRNVDKVSNLTMNMLAYSKARTPVLELTHLPHILKECLDLVRPTAHERKVDLLEEISQTQPPVPVDADGIHQAVLNLLGNAIEAVEAKTGVVTLSSQYDPVKEESVIEVQDNGVGIERYDLDKIFLPFFSTKGQRGTGLGLAVTKKIVEEHEGRIEVQSKVGQGTTFRIRLPMNQRNVPNAAQTHGPK